MAFVESLSRISGSALDNLGAACSIASKGAIGVLKTSDKILAATPIAYYGAEAVNATGFVKVNSTEMAKYVFLVGVVYNFVRGILKQDDVKDEIKNKKLVEYTAASAVALLVAHQAKFDTNAPQLVVASAIAYKIVALIYPKVLEHCNAPTK